MIDKPNDSGVPSHAHTSQELALVEVKGEALMDSRLLAEHLGTTHKHTLAQLEKYRDQLGKVLFKKAPSPDSRTGQTLKFALLTEDQAIVLMTLSQNRKRIVGMKFKLVHAFGVARRNAQARQTEYLPGHHIMHAAVAQKCLGSGNARHIHSNFSTLVNRAVGIESGQRSRAPVATLTIAQQIVTAALAGAVDHKDGYRRAKIALGAMRSLLQGLGVSHGT